MARAVMGALVGQHVSDSQTGLRGIPFALLPSLLRLEANGYDFELDMLIALNLADTKAISEGWFVRLLREVKPLRARVLAKLNATSAEEDE